ncbi:hypothetical protein PsorP6_014490 [Peronosclerospora sorghi]|uniref:Uncharacterized protein n=1 Tax=Peronosclerospora sorghi TaxID=230839 RepID=A0ACC0VTH6_9STRA|nr:hypothetical protein PsorP6_014490 [Peronosclerospora sorghi]
MQNDGQETKAVEETAQPTTSSEDNRSSESRSDVTEPINNNLQRVASNEAVVDAWLEVEHAAKRSGQMEKESHMQPAKREQVVEKEDEETNSSRNVAARINRRRKRNAKAPVGDACGISQPTAMMLFRCSCQALEKQILEYDVRAREMEERNAMQMKEIDEWETRVRCLKRKLEEYADDSPGLVKASPHASERAGDEKVNVLSSTTADTLDLPSVPPIVHAAEIKVQDELRKRTQSIREFSNSVPGFLSAGDSHLF